MLLIVRILIHNGLCLFAAWATIATVVGFTVALVYVDSAGFDSAQLRGMCFNLLLNGVQIKFVTQKIFLNIY